jgi:hypothetical protein
MPAPCRPEARTHAAQALHFFIDLISRLAGHFPDWTMPRHSSYSAHERHTERGRRPPEKQKETEEPRTRIFPAAGRSADAFRAPLARQVCRLACAASFRATRKRQRRIATAASCLAFCHSPAAEASGREHVAFGVPTSFFFCWFPSPAGDDASEADSVRLRFPPGVRPVSYPHKAGALR